MHKALRRLRPEYYSMSPDFLLNFDIVAPLQIVTNPHDVMGVVRETISLCCQATGNPAPQYYEW